MFIVCVMLAGNVDPEFLVVQRLWILSTTLIYWQSFADKLYKSFLACQIPRRPLCMVLLCVGKACCGCWLISSHLAFGDI